MIFYTLPAFLLSGYTWPEIGMVAPIKLISMLQPVHYVLNDFRSLALVGYSQNYVFHTCLLIVVGTIIYGIIFYKTVKVYPK